MNGRIYLRALELNDYLTSYNWRNDTEITAMTGGNRFFVSSEREKEWVKNVIFNTTKLALAICLKENDKYIGNIIFENLNFNNASCEIGIMIGDKDEWNKGYATEAYKLAIKYIFEEKRINRIYALVLEENSSSLKLHKKCGFKIEGILRETIYKCGEFKNQVILSLLKNEYLNRD